MTTSIFDNDFQEHEKEKGTIKYKANECSFNLEKYAVLHL